MSVRALAPRIYSSPLEITMAKSSDNTQLQKTATTIGRALGRAAATVDSLAAQSATMVSDARESVESGSARMQKAGGAAVAAVRATAAKATAVSRSATAGAGKGAEQARRIVKKARKTARKVTKAVRKTTRKAIKKVTRPVKAVRKVVKKAAKKSGGKKNKSRR